MSSFGINPQIPMARTLGPFGGCLVFKESPSIVLGSVSMQLRALSFSIFIFAFGLLFLGCGSPDAPDTRSVHTFADAVRDSLDDVTHQLVPMVSVRHKQARKPRQAGNPQVRVWANMRTGLYHCPGDALWGKTKGKYMTQAEAEQDAFRPAHHHPCQ